MLCLYKWRSRLWSLRIDHLSTCFYLGYAHRSRRGPQLSTLDRVPTSFDRYLGNSLAYSKARRTVPTVGTYGRGDTPSKKSYRGTPLGASQIVYYLRSLSRGAGGSYINNDLYKFTDDTYSHVLQKFYAPKGTCSTPPFNSLKLLPYKRGDITRIRFVNSSPTVSTGSTRYPLWEHI